MTATEERRRRRRMPVLAKIAFAVTAIITAIVVVGMVLVAVL